MKTFAVSAIVAWLLLVPGNAGAQVKSFDLTLEHVLHGGTGVGGTCGGYTTGFGARLSYGIGRLWAVALATRAYVIEFPIHCETAVSPLPDGTYTQVEYDPLLATSFVTTDVRLRANLAPSARSAGIELGLGNAWGSGNDLPYGVLGISIPIPTGQRVQLLIEGEYLILRTAAYRFQRTWQNYQMVSDQPLGRIHEWTDALSLGIGLHVAF